VFLGPCDAARPTSVVRGRPRTDEEIREIIVRLAKENGWGYTRILGELKKLGIRRVSRSTVINVLKQHGLDPGPQRGERSWDEFLRIHAKTLWARDFLSKKVWTKWGLAEFYILFFVHVGSRRVYVSGTARACASWRSPFTPAPLPPGPGNAHNPALRLILVSPRPRPDVPAT
jgi:putative transposase